MPLPWTIESLVNDWSSDVSFVPCVDELGLVPVGSTCLFYGNYGCGKSRLVSTIAGQARSTGHPVLTLDLENRKRTVINIRAQHGLPRDDPDFVWWYGDTKRVKGDGSEVFESPADPDAPVVREWLARKPGAVVVVDSIGRYLARRGMDENATSEVNRTMEQWGGAVLGSGAAALIYIHHVNKGGALRGSIAIPGNVDQAIEIVAKKDPSDGLVGVSLRPEKTRIKQFEPLELKYEGGRFTVGGEVKRSGFAAL